MNEQTNSNTSNNTEIDKALKEFEAKNTEQTQKAPETVSAVPQKAVEGIQFETELGVRGYIDSYKSIKFLGEV